jgi:hypothetical protein
MQSVHFLNFFQLMPLTLLFCTYIASLVYKLFSDNLDKTKWSDITTAYIFIFRIT